MRIALLKFADRVEIKAVNTSGKIDAEGCAYLFRYDSVYGKFEKEVGVVNIGHEPEIGALIIDGKNYPLLSELEPSRIPWKKYGADIVLECTGLFTSEAGARGHLIGGAKKVIISAPEKGGNVGTYILGVNEYKGEHEIVSNASCTTNCVTPLASILNEKLGVEKSVMTTVHATTATQKTTDGEDKDLRRGRSILGNIIPTSTGATDSVTKAMPSLDGIFDGVSLRVPVLSGSIVDFTFISKKQTNTEEVNTIFKEAAKSEKWKGVIAVVDEPIVSSDILGRTESAIVDLELTRVVGGNLVKVFAWYDNEWGYATRLIEQAIAVGTYA